MPLRPALFPVPRSLFPRAALRHAGHSIGCDMARGTSPALEKRNAAAREILRARSPRRPRRDSAPIASRAGTSRACKQADPAWQSLEKTNEFTNSHRSYFLDGPPFQAPHRPHAAPATPFRLFDFSTFPPLTSPNRYLTSSEPRTPAPRKTASCASPPRGPGVFMRTERRRSFNPI